MMDIINQNKEKSLHFYFLVYVQVFKFDMHYEISYTYKMK